MLDFRRTVPRPDPDPSCKQEWRGLFGTNGSGWSQEDRAISTLLPWDHGTAPDTRMRAHPRARHEGCWSHGPMVPSLSFIHELWIEINRLRRGVWWDQRGTSCDHVENIKYSGFIA